MRWPLRNQIMVRMLLVLLIAISAITYANIRTLILSNRDAENARMTRIVKLVRATSFPLTHGILKNMKALSGAEFVIISENGTLVSKTDFAGQSDLAEAVQVRNIASEVFHEPIQLGDSEFYHSAIHNPNARNVGGGKSMLHIFLSRQPDETVWWSASRTPLLIACLALPLTFLASLALASQVTQPLAKLKSQVQLIAGGDVQLLPKIQGNNEIGDLGISINEMASKLKDHEVQLKKNARLDTLVQFGSSIAHHLRNSSTGCRMAVELLASERSEIAASQNYQVALRQLGLMDRYIKKFLLLAKSPDVRLVEEKRPIELGAMLDEIEFLLRPSVDHLNVGFKVEKLCDGSRVTMASDDAEQMMINLIKNAISAAALCRSGGEEQEEAQVDVSLETIEGSFVFTVADNGAGPADAIADNMFQPFVTGSSEGTGLGLSLVRQIADDLGASIGWKRIGHQTVFKFEFNADSRKLPKQ